MRRWFVLLFILGIAALPFSAQAQSAVKFSSLQIQLWPEYDQPSMLVICEFKLARWNEPASGCDLPHSEKRKFGGGRITYPMDN